MSSDCDIVVVGGGIVGLAAFSALRAGGFDVRLIERAELGPTAAADEWDPRVYAITEASASLLASLGVWQGFDKQRISAISEMQVWDRSPARALRFSAVDRQAEQLGWIIEHRQIAQGLLDAAHRDEIYFSREVRGLELADDHAELKLSDQSVLRTRLVIGAEGSNSNIREMAGIEVSSGSYHSRALVCHVETSRQHHGAALQRFLTSGPLALLPLADGRRSLVWSTTDAQATQLLELDDRRFCAALEECFQSSAGQIRAATKRISFPLKVLHAQDYVAERCALIGDSAHVIHPLAGQGLNLGLADVAEMAATLIAARDAGRDWSALRTLRKYGRARHAENLEMLALTDALNRAFSLDISTWKNILSFGLNAVERVGPLKKLLTARAAGAH